MTNIPAHATGAEFFVELHLQCQRCGAESKRKKQVAGFEANHAFTITSSFEPTGYTCAFVHVDEGTFAEVILCGPCHEEIQSAKIHTMQEMLKGPAVKRVIEKNQPGKKRVNGWWIVAAWVGGGLVAAFVGWFLAMGDVNLGR